MSQTRCGPKIDGYPRGPASPTATGLGVLNVFDYYDEFSDGTPTEWIQKCVNLAINQQLPLYFPASSGSVQAPYYLTGKIIVDGACHLLGPPAESSFSQGPAPPYPVTESGRAMFWTDDPTLEMVCVVFTGNVIIENIDFCVVPSSSPTTGGGRAVHVRGGSGPNKILNSVMYGPWTGVYVDAGGGLEIDNVTVIPYATTSGSGQYGFMTDGTLSGDANDTQLTNCIVDQSQYPFSGPPGSATPHTVDAFVSQNSYATTIFKHCSAIAADTGFLAQTVPPGTGNVSFFQVLDSQAYNCNTSVELGTVSICVVEGGTFTTDTSSGTQPNATQIFGISVPPSTTGGAITLRNNIIIGNGTTPMVGLDLQSGSTVAVAGGAILGCGPQAAGAVGDGISICGTTSGSQFTIGGIVVSGSSRAGLHIGAGHLGAANVTALTLAGNVNAASSSSAGILIDALTGSAPGIVTIADCVIIGNNVQVSNGNVAVTTGAVLPMKLANNAGYNPAGPPTVTIPAPVMGVTYANNTGVDEFVYLLGTSASTTGSVSLDGTAPPVTQPVGPTQSMYVVPAGSTIELQLGNPAPTGWIWVGN